MKFGPVIQYDKKKKKASEKFNDDVMSKNCDIISLLQITANLEQSGS